MVNLDIVYEWIASLPMAGIDVRKLENLQLDSTLRGLPIFQPDITAEVVGQPVERNSFGTGATAKMTFRYTVPYVLLYKPVGAGRSVNENTPEVVALLKTIYSAILENDTPASVDDVTVDILPVGCTFGRTVSDPSGGQWHGAKVTINAQEFIN